MAEGEKIAAVLRVQEFPGEEGQRFIVMGTRSGSIDPGIALHLLRQGIAEFVDSFEADRTASAARRLEALLEGHFGFAVDHLLDLGDDDGLDGLALTGEDLLDGPVPFDDALVARECAA